MTPAKKEARNLRNKERKQRNAEMKKYFMQMLGRTVTEYEVPTEGLKEDGTPVTKTVLDFPKYIRTTADGSVIQYRGQRQQPNALAFLAAKTYVQRNGGRKNRPGNKELHSEALIANNEWNMAHPKDIPQVPINEVGADTMAHPSDGL